MWPLSPVAPGRPTKLEIGPGLPAWPGCPSEPRSPNRNHSVVTGNRIILLSTIQLHRTKVEVTCFGQEMFHSALTIIQGYFCIFDDNLDIFINFIMFTSRKF